MNWHQQTLTDVFKSLGSNAQGLSASIASEKILQVGPNQLQEGKKKTIAGIFFGQFKDVMILILMAAAIVSGIIGDLQILSSFLSSCY